MKQSITSDDVECLAPFRFQVTWCYLSEPAIESVPEPVIAAIPVPAIPVASVPATSISPKPSDGVVSRAGTAPAAQWEMVIPKMNRPAVAPARLRIAEVPEAAPAAPQTATAAIEFAPHLLLNPVDSLLTRYWRWIAVAVIVMASIGFTLLVRPEPGSSRATPNESDSAMTGGWTRRGVSGYGRVVSVYDPSRSESNYRVEFAWVPDAIGVGWLFRIRDGSNYYGARLSLLQPGASTALVVEHFGVVGGVESAHSRKVIALAGSGGALRVRMDAAGPAFTLWAQGSPVDYWTDARLTAGPFGFYDERGQRPTLQTVRFTFFQKGAARTAVTSFR